MENGLCEFLSINEQKVAKIQKYLKANSRLEKTVEIFKALSDPTRLKIVMALEQEELCVCDIAALINLSQPSVSHHLKALKYLGLVKCRKIGKMAIYYLNTGRVSALLSVARDFARDQA